MEDIGPERPYINNDVMEWEIPERRVTLPNSLLVALGIESTVLRVPHNVDHKIRTKHPEVIQEYLSLAKSIDAWNAYRVRERRTEVYMKPDARGNRTLVLIGYDRSGSLNLISMYQVRERNWRNRGLISKE